MPTYIMLSKLTDEGRKTIKEKPDRIKEVNREIGAMGVKVEAQNNETIGRVSVDLGSRGTVQLTTWAAIPIDEFIANLKKKR